MSRRGRGFNAQEVANLRSWGVEPRPDEIEPETPAHRSIGVVSGLSPSGLAILGQQQNIVRDAAIRAFAAEARAMQNLYRPIEPDDELDVK